MNKFKKVVIFEAVVIIILIIFLIINYYSCSNYYNEYSDEGKFKFLSPRIYSGILPSESFLILNFEPLKKDIQNYIAANNLNLSVYVINIRDGASFGINEENPFEAVSLNKLPTAIIILRKVEDGKLSLDTLLPISPEDRTGGSGPLSTMPVNQLSVKELLRYMLQESDNAAFWVLAKQVSLEEGQQLTAYLNYYKDYNSSGPAKSLQISPKTTGNLFLSLYLSTVLLPEHSELILSYLSNTSFDIKKYAKLPEEVIVSQKYGSSYYGNTKLFHSCGILYIDSSRIFYCVMSSGLEQENAKNTVGEVVNKIYNYVIAARKTKE